MRYAKAISLILLFLPLVALASPEVEPLEDFPDPLPLFVVFLFFGVCLVLVGIGMVLALAALALSGLLVAFGVISTSALIALARRRVSAGLRAFHYQLFAIACAPCGVIVFGLAAALLHFPIRHRYVLLFGLFAGISTGLTMAFLSDRLAHLICRRFLSQNDPGTVHIPNA